MVTSIPKNLTFFISNQASVHICISPVSLSLSLPRFLSTQTHTKINPTVYHILVHKHNFPCQFASRVSSELSSVKNPDRVDSVLTFFKSIGFSNTQLQKILNSRPRHLCSSLEANIKPKIKGFQDEGFSSADISKIFSSNPRILELSLNENIIPSLSLLKGLMGSNDVVLRVVSGFPRILCYNLEGTVVANVEFLKSCGLSVDRIRIILISYPQVFCLKPQLIRASTDKAKEMGLTAASGAFLYAITTIAPMSNEAWELKLHFFRDMGFSESDILCMFRKEPRVFAVSVEKMKKIMKGLVGTGRFDISAIVDRPVSLMYSFEKRYEPRIRILRILESRKLIEAWPTLVSLSYFSDALFFKSFIRPHLDQLSDVDVAIKLSPFMDKVIKS